MRLILHVFLVLILMLPGHPARAYSNKLVIAHRGASGYVPEHTLAATALAYGMGANFIEQDVVLTKDDVPVVLHDIHLDTVTDVAKRFPQRAREDGRYYAIDFTLEEIKTLRVHERLNPKTHRVVFPRRFPVGKSAFQVPTLAEAIELIQGLNTSTGGQVGIYPEIKAPAWHRRQGKDITVIVLQTLRDYGYADAQSNIYLQCFDADELKRIRHDLHSTLKLIQLLGGDTPSLITQEGLRSIAEYAQGIGPSMWLIVRRAEGQREIHVTSLVKDAHAVGLEVHPYTFRADALPDYARSFEHLLGLFYFEIGVDGVFTDFPDRVVRYLNEAQAVPGDGP